MLMGGNEELGRVRLGRIKFQSTKKNSSCQRIEGDSQRQYFAY